jgi:hypothetical protein
MFSYAIYDVTELFELSTFRTNLRPSVGLTPTERIRGYFACSRVGADGEPLQLQG